MENEIWKKNQGDNELSQKYLYKYYILLMSYYTYFIYTIYLLKWFENNYTPYYGLSLMEKYIASFFTVQILISYNKYLEYSLLKKN